VNPGKYEGQRKANDQHEQDCARDSSRKIEHGRDIVDDLKQAPRHDGRLQPRDRCDGVSAEEEIVHARASHAVRAIPRGLALGKREFHVGIPAHRRIWPCACRGEAAMTAELTYLVWSLALTLVQVVIAVGGATLQVGLPRLAGNREGMPEMMGWAGRAARAHSNMLESLVLFAALVLVAHAAGIHNGMTLLGAQLFFWGRVAHAVIYLIGLPWL
jgi:uncharacterized MAPEG superfamily protein